jgi:hypothetical protein
MWVGLRNRRASNFQNHASPSFARDALKRAPTSFLIVAVAVILPRWGAAVLRPYGNGCTPLRQFGFVLTFRLIDNSSFLAAS